MYSRPKIQYIWYVADLALIGPNILPTKLYPKSLYPILNRAFVSPKTERAFLMIVGVYCTSCKPIVEKQLREEKAIKNINIEFMTVSLYTLAHH